MSVVWKYPVPAQDSFEITARGHAQPLAVQMQNGEAALWLLISDASAAAQTYRFRVVPTGAEFSAEGCAYVGTFQPEQGLVFHLFMETP